MDPDHIQQAWAKARVQSLLSSLGGSGQSTVVASTRSVRAFHEDDGGDPGLVTAFRFAYESLPDPPVTPDAPLASACAARPGDQDDDAVDRISVFPNQILRNVVSRLPARDAVRTGALATRWRGIWRAVPLVFVDTHLLPSKSRAADPSWRPRHENTLGITNAVTSVLATHPGPFCCVHISCCYMDYNREHVELWFKHLATKGVQDLAFINRPWPLELPLPATLFSCKSLTRLHIGAWKFPDTADLPRTAAFPHLTDLFLSVMLMKDRDLAFLLDRSPVLEVLTIIGSRTSVCLTVVSRSLRCLHIVWSSVGDIIVEDAPCLERFLVYFTSHITVGGSKCASIKIGKSPNLRMLGYWQPAAHELQISNTVIGAGTKVGPSAIIPSVKILGLDVNFEARIEAKKLPFFFKCFPNVETLHINSFKVDEPTGKVNLKFWQEAGPIECVQRHFKKLVIHWCHGKRGELAFLKFIAERAEVMEKMVILLCPECFPSMNAVKSKLGPLTTAKWASKNFKVILFKKPAPAKRGTAPWCVRTATNFSCGDPFDFATGDEELSNGALFFSSGNQVR